MPLCFPRVCSIQVGFIVIIMMAFFVFTSQTIFVRFGRYDKYLKEYGLFYGVALVQLLMIAAVKAYYIVSSGLSKCDTLQAVENVHGARAGWVAAIHRTDKLRAEGVVA